MVPIAQPCKSPWDISHALLWDSRSAGFHCFCCTVCLSLLQASPLLLQVNPLLPHPLGPLASPPPRPSWVSLGVDVGGGGVTPSWLPLHIGAGMNRNSTAFSIGPSAAPSSLDWWTQFYCSVGFTVNFPKWIIWVTNSSQDVTSSL